MNNKKILAIYVRVSTEEQAKNGYGLLDQENQCRKYVDLYYPEHQNIIIYKDDGYSAKDLKRPQIQELIRRLDNDEVEVIVTFKLDRITRSVIDTYSLIDKCTKHDCTLIAVVDKLDISSANGRMLVGILSTIAQWEREVISERTIAGMTQMAKEGKYPCGISPFGWKKKEDLTLEIDETQAEIINYMADLYLQGYSFEDISKKVKYKYNIDKSYACIKRYLINPLNIGNYKFRNESFNDIVPAIMSDEKYNNILEAMKYRQHYSNGKKKYIFHSLVQCKCGERCDQVSTVKTITSRHKKIYYYYCCPKCQKRINQDKLVKKCIISILSEKASLELGKKKDLIKKELNLVDTQIGELYDKYQQGNMSIDVYTYTVEKLIFRKKEIEHTLECIKFEKIDDFYALDTIKKYNYLHSLIKKIIIDFSYDEVIKIEYKSID